VQPDPLALPEPSEVPVPLEEVYDSQELTVFRKASILQLPPIYREDDSMIVTSRVILGEESGWTLIFYQ